MSTWRAWYADGRVVDSRAASVFDLPPTGLAIVMEYHAPPYRTIHHGEYLYFDGQWHTALTPAEIPVGARVFPGTLMPDPAWATLQARAFADGTG